MPDRIEKYLVANSLSMTRDNANREEPFKLNQGERSILGYFPSSTKADKAVEQLKNMGIKTVQLDRISRYGVSNDDEHNAPLTGTASTQTGLSLFSTEIGEIPDPSARVLLGADPSVSGMASRGYGMAGGYPFLVTVVTDDNQADEVARIIKAHGGYV